MEVDYSDFLNVYREALVNEDAFNNFRHNLNVHTTLIEHVSYGTGNITKAKRPALYHAPTDRTRKY